MADTDDTPGTPRGIKFPREVEEPVKLYAELYHAGNFSAAVRDLCMQALAHRREMRLEPVGETLYRFVEP